MRLGNSSHISPALPSPLIPNCSPISPSRRRGFKKNKPGGKQTTPRHHWTVHSQFNLASLRIAQRWRRPPTSGQVHQFGTEKARPLLRPPFRDRHGTTSHWPNWRSVYGPPVRSSTFPLLRGVSCDSLAKSGGLGRSTTICSAKLTFWHGALVCLNRQRSNSSTRPCHRCFGPCVGPLRSS